jgi:hypothetical protein
LPHIYERAGAPGSVEFHDVTDGVFAAAMDSLPPEAKLARKLKEQRLP